MFAEEYLTKSRLYRRLKDGPHGQGIELYAARVVKDGLARQGMWRCLMRSFPSDQAQTLRAEQTNSLPTERPAARLP